MQVNIRNKAGKTALHLAVECKNVPIVKMLMARNDTDVSLQDNDGRTPLHIAVMAKSTDIIELLMQRDDLELSLTDHSGMTPLQLAGNNIQIVNLLTQGMPEANRTEILQSLPDDDATSEEWGDPSSSGRSYYHNATTLILRYRRPNKRPHLG